jgi:hypothetical protein
MDIFDRLVYFRRHESWGDPTRVSGILLLTLDALRGIVRHKFIIHCCWADSGHSSNSQHYLGNAVDFHVEGCNPFIAVGLIEEALAELQAAEHCGLGLYPDWRPVPGFHFDVRGERARWGFVSGDEAAVQVSYDTARKIIRERW